MVRPRKDDDVIYRMGVYLIGHYHKLIDMYGAKCPYRFDSEELDTFVAHVWGSYAAILPGTKTRLVDDYAKRRVRDPAIASKIRRTDQILIDTFRVLYADRERGKFLLRSKTDGAEYRAVSGVLVAAALSKGGTYVLMIHPWEEDGSYNIASVFHDTVQKRNYRFLQRA